jgi:K+-transporting ATPase KdpF subunit
MGVRGGVKKLENVILAVGASLVMVYLIIALIRPERF